MSDSDLDDRSMPNLRTLVFSFVFLFITAIILAEIFVFVSAWVGSLWLSALVVHVLLIAIVLLGWNGAVKKSNSESIQKFQSRHPIFHRRAVVYYLPAAIILVGAVAVALVSGDGFSAAAKSNIGVEQLAFIFVVPLVEELFYRWAVGGMLRPRLGFLAAGYLSALFFSFMHSQPNIERVLEGNFGFVLGPFLLGVVCEFLYGISSRLGPAVLFHMSCNATVAIFALLDPRWLDWLSPLYSS